MAKAPTSVIGIDLGRSSLKSVLLQRRNNRVAMTHYGCLPTPEPATTAEALAKQLKALLKDMGGSARACVLSVSSPDALIRIIEQPQTPPHILRDALRLNGMTLLNQEVRSFVLDCDLIPGAEVPTEPGEGGPKLLRYLVGGLPRTEVQRIGEAVTTAGIGVQRVQLSPVSIFNAFEFTHPDIFNQEAFFLLDIGHTTSTVMVGAQRSLVLVRSIEFGGKSLTEALTGLSGEDRQSVFEALEQEDEVMVEYTRVAINTVAREIGSSIGFYEARHEQTIGKVFVSGGPARSKMFLRLMSEELGMPCEAWSAVDQCENALAAARRADFDRDDVDLNAACGAATEALLAK